MKGGLHHGLRSTRSEEVYQGSQQARHRRRAQAECLGSCQDVCDGGMGKYDSFLVPLITTERQHTTDNIFIYFFGLTSLDSEEKIASVRADAC